MISRNKILLLALLVLLFFSSVMARLVYLQLFKKNTYQKISDNYSLKEVQLLAPRGNILDRHGEILATTRPSFNLFLTRQKVKNSVLLFAKLAEATGQSPQFFSDVFEKYKKYPRYKPLLFLQDLSSDQAAKLGIFKNLAQKDPDYEDFLALEVKVEPLRSYPAGEAFAHPLGFVREIGEEQLKLQEEKSEKVYEAGDLIGVQGLEKFYDLNLRGMDGREQKLVDALGREMNAELFGLDQELLHQQAIPGKDLKLTLDAGLQRTAYRAFGKQSGSLVVLDVQHGEVLAMVSRPSYNPDLIVSNANREYWKKINTDEGKVLLNRTLQGAYPPGSTFKIVTGLAGLMESKITPQEKITCPGFYKAGSRRFNCWTPKGHGPVDLYQALVSSCDVYFYRLGERLGVDKIAYYAKKLGLGSLTGIDLNYERSGLVPTTEWKKEVRKEEWNPSETLSVAIGQGYNLVTPLQNALMMARVAAKGKDLQPHLALSEEFEKKEKNEFKIPQAIDQVLLNALKGVVHDPTGTAHKIQISGLTLGGKTGTAQVVNYDVYGRKAKSRKTEDHAWFVGFAPVEKPEIALAVVVEHGGHGGSAAAPIAKEVFRKYFEDKMKADAK